MRIFSLFFVFLSCLLHSVNAQVDESKEPPLDITLEINGKDFSIELGQRKRISGEFKDPTVVVRTAATRTFNYGRLSFDYPAEFTWEAQIKDQAFRYWTLSGNDSKIMYFVFRDEMTPTTFADSLMVEFGKPHTKVSDMKRTLNNQVFLGKRVSAKLAGSEITQDILAIPGPAKQWRLLILQDVAPEMTPQLDEPKLVLDLLDRSLSAEP